jgi:hypothetical protein
MIPAKLIKKEDLELKAQLFKDWKSTTHWPHCNLHPQAAPLRNDSVAPRVRGEPIIKPEITDQLQQFAEFKAF